MLATFSIITGILLVIFCFSLSKEWEAMPVISGALLILIGLICWCVIGTAETTKVTIKVVPKSNYEILIGEDKIIVTNMYNKLTETFDDARTYNIIKNKTDKYYLEYTKYNMYGYNLGSFIEIKDLRFIK
jgi:vancomycin permeability regulator SanA